MANDCICTCSNIQTLSSSRVRLLEGAGVDDAARRLHVIAKPAPRASAPSLLPLDIRACLTISSRLPDAEINRVTRPTGRVVGPARLHRRDFPLQPQACCFLSLPHHNNILSSPLPRCASLHHSSEDLPHHPILDSNNMCYQAFIQHACGHGDIIDANCELAEGQPFYIKQACPNYQFESKFPDSFCGKALFYCTHAEGDGQWLDALQEGLWRCNAEIWILEGKIYAVLEKVRALFLFTTGWDGGRWAATAAAAAEAPTAATMASASVAKKLTSNPFQTKQFMECALSWGVPMEASKLHPVYPKLRDMLLRLDNEKTQKEAVRDQAITTLNQVREHFARRGEAITASLVPKPAFVSSGETLNKVPLELDWDVQPHPDLLGPCIPEAAPAMTMPANEQPEIAAAPAVSLTRQENSSLALLEGENITVDHVHQGTDSPNAEEPKPAEANTPADTTSSSSTPMQSTAARKDHLAKRVLKRQLRNNRTRSSRAASPEKVTPVNEDNGFVRRSTRVRNKASYAESAGSDFSRDSSPVKSDGSPAKSDWSASSERSPEPSPKRKRQSRGDQNQDDDGGQRFRGSETLASKIGDWKRRTGNSKDATSSTSVSEQDVQAASGQDVTNTQPNPVEKPRRRKSKRTKGGQPANPGMYILDNGAFPYTNSMSGTLGRPFPDNSNAAAVVSRNIFNQYLQQSMPGGMAQSQPAQAPHPLDLQKPPGERLKPIQTQLPESIFDEFSMPQLKDQQQAQNAGSALETTDLCPMVNQSAQPSSFVQPPSMVAQPHGYNSGYDFSSNPYAPCTPQPSTDEKADNVTEGYERQNLPRVDISTYFDYDRMDRSFGAVQDLSPPKTPGVVVTDFDLEPKKRASTASSPPPAAKRIRLLLPGDDAGAADSAVAFSDGSSSYGAGNRMATSSPAKMSFQLARTEFMDAMKNDEQAATPAPIMAPTAITYPQSQTVSNLENMCKDAAAAEDNGGGEVGSGEQEQQSWDDGLVFDGMDQIDWALLDGDDGFAAFGGL